MNRVITTILFLILSPLFFAEAYGHILFKKTFWRKLYVFQHLQVQKHEVEYAEYPGRFVKSKLSVF